MTELKDILAIYDDSKKKRFEYYDVSADIQKLSESIVSENSAQSEILAMMFQDGGGKDVWNTYYGPMVSGTRINKETGESEPAYNPDYQWITCEHFDYWLRRAKETNNPFMRMRYLGLIFDFKKLVTGKDADYKTVKVPYIESIIKVISEEYYQHEIIGLLYAERAIQCSSSLNNVDLIDKAKSCLLLLNEKTKNKDDSPGLWGKCFDLMMDYQYRFSDKEILLFVGEAETRFARIEKHALSEGRTTDIYAHHLKDQADLLCRYYEKKGDSKTIEDLLDRVCSAIKLSADARGGMWLHGMLSQMQALYRKYHLDKRANKLYLDIQKSGTKVIGEMHRFNMPITLDRDLLDKYMEEALAGNNQEVIRRYIIEYIPKLPIERQRQIEEAKTSPLLDLVSTITYDAMGTPINNIGVGKNAEEQKLMFGMYRRMQVSAIFLRMVVKKMIEQKILTYEVVINSFERSVVLSDGQRPLFERGMKAYFEEDYMVACHLLVPQFESAIRRLVYSHGGDILRQDKDPKTGNQYLALDSLLAESAELKALFQEDVLVYFRNLFTDQNGWNLRNQTSHGLLPADSFNSSMADRIVHAFMILSEVGEKEQ